MKHKVSELEGDLLDAAVAKADRYGSAADVPVEACGQDTTGGAKWWNPSADWEQAGPIIERERIATWPSEDGWCARHPTGGPEAGGSGYMDPSIGIIDCRWDATGANSRATSMCRRRRPGVCTKSTFQFRRRMDSVAWSFQSFTCCPTTEIGASSWRAPSSSTSFMQRWCASSLCTLDRKVHNAPRHRAASIRRDAGATKRKGQRLPPRASGPENFGGRSHHEIAGPRR